MKIGALPLHPHFPMLLSEINILLDNATADVVKHAERSEERQVRIAVGTQIAFRRLLTELKEAKRRTDDEE